MTGSQVQVLLQSRFSLCTILSVLSSTGSLFSTLESQCPWEALICCREFKKCTHMSVFDSLPIPCRHFVAPLRTDKKTCRRVFCSCRTCPGKSYSTFECWTRQDQCCWEQMHTKIWDLSSVMSVGPCFWVTWSWKTRWSGSQSDTRPWVCALKMSRRNMMLWLLKHASAWKMSCLRRKWIPTRRSLWRMLTVISKSIEILSCVGIVVFLWKKETTYESGIDLIVEPLTSCDQATDEHDVIPHTRKRRRLTHKSPVSVRFSVDFDEDDAIQVQADCSVSVFSENLVEKRAVVGTICATGFEDDSLSAVLETSCQSADEAEPGGHEYFVHLLEKGDDTTQLHRCVRNRWYEDRVVSTKEASGVPSSGRSATELVVLGTEVKMKLLQHDTNSLIDTCRSSTSGFLLYRLLEPSRSLRKTWSSGSVCGQRLAAGGGSGKRRRRRPANLLVKWLRSAHKAWTRTSLSVLFSEKVKTRLVLFILSSLWSIMTTCVSYPGWNRSRGSESASTWLSFSFCATTQCIQLETEFAAGYVREDDESSSQRVFLGFARLTRKSIESILSSFDHFSQRSTSFWIIEFVTRNTNTADSPIFPMHHHHSFCNPCVRHWRNSFSSKTVDIPFWTFWNIYIRMMMSDHSFLSPPATKHRLRWRTQRQKWKLIVKLICHRQHCHRQRHLLLRRVRIHLSEKRSPIDRKNIHQQIADRDNRKNPNLQLSDTSPPRTKTFLLQFWRLAACTDNTQWQTVMLDVSSWLMLAHVLRWSPSLRKLVNVPLVVIRLWSARNRCWRTDLFIVEDLVSFELIQTVVTWAMQCSTRCITTSESTSRWYLERHRGIYPSHASSWDWWSGHRTFTRWIRDESFLVKSVFCKLWRSIDVFSKRRYTRLQLLFGHESVPIEGEALDDEQPRSQYHVVNGREIDKTAVSHEGVVASRSRDPYRTSRKPTHTCCSTLALWNSCVLLESRRPEYGFSAHVSAGVYRTSEQTQGCMVGSCDSSDSGNGP